MFECDCTPGYELNLDGYSCRPRNISFSFSYNESKFDDDYSNSDVFYQKGVSFSAKLEEASDKSKELRDMSETHDDIVHTEIDNQR